MDQSTGQPYPDQHTGVRNMGRGPGVRVVNGAIQIDFRWRGERRRERLRLAPTKANLKHAARLKAIVEHEITIGTFDYAKHFPRSTRVRHRVTVGTPLNISLLAYVDSLASELEPETLKKYRLDAATVAGWFAPDETLKTLTRPKVRDAIAKLDLSKKRILNLLTPLRGAVTRAADDGDLTSNPLTKLTIRRLRKPDRNKLRPFTPAEVDALSRTPLGDLWVAWAWIGLRPGEVIGLEKRDVDLEGAKLRVERAVRVGRQKAPKTAAGARNVALLPPAIEALRRAMPKTEGPMFTNPNTGERWHEDRGLARAFRIACKAAGVAYRPPKHLRHTFASWALSSGENPLWVAQQMGHEDTTMIFKVYGEWIPSVDPLAGQRMIAKAG
jgi:integrase